MRSARPPAPQKPVCRTRAIRCGTHYPLQVSQKRGCPEAGLRFIINRKNDLTDENIDCSNLLKCFSHVLNLGVRHPQGFGMFIKKKDEEGRNQQTFFISMTFFFIINIILLKTMFANIVGAFSQIRVEDNVKNDILKNTCILCGVARTTQIKNNIDFDEHVTKIHNPFDYMGFQHYLKEKGNERFDIFDPRKILKKPQNSLELILLDLD